MDSDRWLELLGVLAIGAALGFIIAKSMYRPASYTSFAHNEERWSWTDYKGIKREILVERKVEGY
jgi:hypothetical protein